MARVRFSTEYDIDQREVKSKSDFPATYGIAVRGILPNIEGDETYIFIDTNQCNVFYFLSSDNECN